jgi:hypothetical protein
VSSLSAAEREAYLRNRKLSELFDAIDTHLLRIPPLPVSSIFLSSELLTKLGFAVLSCDRSTHPILAVEAAVESMGESRLSIVAETRVELYVMKQAAFFALGQDIVRSLEEYYKGVVASVLHELRAAVVWDKYKHRVVGAVLRR